MNVAETEAMFRKFLRSPSKIASVNIYDNYKTEDFFFCLFLSFSDDEMKLHEGSAGSNFSAC